MAGPTRFERATHSFLELLIKLILKVLKGYCSTKLSYGPNGDKKEKIDLNKFLNQFNDFEFHFYLPTS